MTLHIAHGDIMTTYNIDGFCHQVNCLTVKYVAPVKRCLTGAGDVAPENGAKPVQTVLN